MCHRSRPLLCPQHPPPQEGCWAEGRAGLEWECLPLGNYRGCLGLLAPGRFPPNWLCDQGTGHSWRWVGLYNRAWVWRASGFWSCPSPAVVQAGRSRRGIDCGRWLGSAPVQRLLGSLEPSVGSSSDTSSPLGRPCPTPVNGVKGLAGRGTRWVSVCVSSQPHALIESWHCHLLGPHFPHLCNGAVMVATL